MREIGQTARIFAMVLVAIGSTWARSDETSKPGLQAVDPVDRILVDWQVKASKITSVEARFRRTDYPKGWGRTRYMGRLILSAPNLALLENSSVGEDGKVTGLVERLIWNGRSILQFAADEHKVFRFPIAKEWPSAPSQLRLPFFFRMTVEEAKRDYDWTLLKEDPDQILLKASSKRKSLAGGKDPENFLFLDRKTFLPKRLIQIEAEDRGRRTYDVVEIKVNAIEDLDALMEPCLDSWTIVEKNDALTRLFLK